MRSKVIVITVVVIKRALLFYIEPGTSHFIRSEFQLARVERTLGGTPRRSDEETEADAVTTATIHHHHHHQHPHLLGSGKECIELQTFTGGAAGLAWHTTTGAPPGSAVWCLLMQRERATFTGSSSSSINLLYFRYTQSFILPAFFEQFQSARTAC